MIRALLTTTAITALLTTGALAEDPAKGANDAAGATSYSSEASTAANAAGTDGERYIKAAKGQILASNLMGETLYNGTGEEAEAIGDVNDVVMSPEGDVEAVVIGAGGFLGVGEKEVAVNFDRISWTERDGDRFLTAEVTKEELESAPEFDRAALEPSQDEMQTSMADDTATGTATGGTAGSSDMINSDPHAASGSGNEAMSEDAATMDQAANDTAASDPAMEGDNASTDEMAASDESMTSAENGEMAGTNVDPSVLSADDLIGTAVVGANDADLGDVNDVIVSPDGELVAYIIDVGGFLGLGEKPVALDATQLKITKDENGDMRIHTTMSEEELKSYPTYSEEAYKANPDAVLVR